MSSSVPTLPDLSVRLTCAKDSFEWKQAFLAAIAISRRARAAGEEHGTLGQWLSLPEYRSLVGDPMAALPPTYAALPVLPDNSTLVLLSNYQPRVQRMADAMQDLQEQVFLLWRSVDAFIQEELRDHFGPYAPSGVNPRALLAHLQAAHGTLSNSDIQTLKDQLAAPAPADTPWDAVAARHLRLHEQLVSSDTVIDVHQRYQALRNSIHGRPDLVAAFEDYFHVTARPDQAFSPLLAHIRTHLANSFAPTIGAHYGTAFSAQVSAPAATTRPPPGPTKKYCTHHKFGGHPSTECHYIASHPTEFTAAQRTATAPPKT